MSRLAAPLLFLFLVADPQPSRACTGDCDGGGTVTIDEIMRGVTIALGEASVFSCGAFDANGDERIAIDELIASVSAALDGCATPPVTPTDGPPTQTPTATPTSGPFMPFCDLPGSLQFTESGTVLVPGGPSGTPDLSFLHLPTGFCVHYYGNVGDARQLRFAPGGELFVASPTTLTTGGGATGPDGKPVYDSGLEAIVILPDDDRDGLADQVIKFLKDLPSTQGMMFANGHFYYQDRARILRLPYQTGDRAPSAESEEVVTLNETTGRYNSRLHWPKMLDIADDGRIFVTNGGDQGERCDPARPLRGGIFEIDGTPGGKPIAKGFRNPISVRCLRGYNRCYAIELSRDYSNNIGGREKLVPVREGDDWGFPCCATAHKPYPDLMPVPDCSDVDVEGGSFVIGNTPFDLDFETGKWPPPWNNRVYIPMHGVFATWEGERLVSIAFDPVTGEVIMGSELPSDDPGSFLDFATGWDDGPAFQGPHGRPANIAFAPDGRLFLGNDYTGDILWIAPMGM
jgi:glucose/arabinose dehydrogenase